MFVSSRRDISATKSAVAVYDNEIRVRSDLRLNIGIDAADITAITHIFAIDSDSNHIICCGDATAGSSAQGGVETSSGIS